MNAYRMLDDGNERPEYSEEMTTVSLPRVRCDVCKSVWGGWVYHPSLKCSAKTLAAISAAKDPVSLEELDKLRKRIPCDDESLWDLPPGCELGVQLILMDGPLCFPDFDPLLHCTLVSEKALKILADNGIKVYSGEVKILEYSSRKRVHGWRALDFPDMRVMTENAIRKCRLIECKRCGEVRHADLKAWRNHELIKDRWPPSLGVARLVESGRKVASPEFIEVWKKHKLKGLRFERIGKWV